MLKLNYNYVIVIVIEPSITITIVIDPRSVPDIFIKYQQCLESKYMRYLVND